MHCYLEIECFGNSRLCFSRIRLFYPILNLIIQFQAVLLFVLNRIDQYLSDYFLAIDVYMSKISLINNQTSFRIIFTIPPFYKNY